MFDFKMFEFTVSQVAGMINAGVVLGTLCPTLAVLRCLTYPSAAQLTFPLIVVFILVGIINNVNNAITW